MRLEQARGRALWLEQARDRALWLEQARGRALRLEQSRDRALRLGNTWEVAAWEIAQLAHGKRPFGKYLTSIFQILTKIHR